MSTPEFKIPVSELDAGGREYTFPVRDAWIRGALEGHEATGGGKDGALAVRASKSGSDVVVHGSLAATLTLPCARCLEPYLHDIKQDISVLYVPATRLGPRDGDGERELELDEAEADTLPYDGESVVLDDFVRDELQLEVPMIPLCSEGCPGMSPAPALDQEPAEAPAKEIDPRLAPLLAFQAKTKKS